MVVAGQHISAAIHAVYVNLVLGLGYKPEDVPDTLKYVNGAVLSADCPTMVARMAAGHHQRQQHHTVVLSTADMMKIMVHDAELWQQQGDTPYLSDDKLHGLLMSIGLIKENAVSSSVHGTETFDTLMVCIVSSFTLLYVFIAPEGHVLVKVQATQFHGWGRRCQ